MINKNRRLTKKQIINKINSWKNNPMMAPAIYRLFIHLDLADIPEPYKTEFEKKMTDDVRAEWDKPTYEERIKDLEIDIKNGAIEILKSLVTGQVVKAFGNCSVLIADLFMITTKADKYQGELAQIVNNYVEVSKTSRLIAEAQAINELAIFLEKAVKEVEQSFTFSVDELVNNILSNEPYKMLFEDEDLTKDAKFMQGIDKALEEYEGQEN